jgi:dinuclear metal center YbgI/SA1388 family protein
MATLAETIVALEQIAPLRLAADWDSVGLLVGTRRPAIARVLTCLTLTDHVAREAVRERADMIVAHHPLPFHPIARITDDDPTGRVLLEIMGAGIAVWSPHTAWDSAAGGINDQLAAFLGLEHVTPIEPDELHHLTGFGRVGTASSRWTVADAARHLVEKLRAADATVAVPGVQVVGDPDRGAGRVGIVCGSGGEAVSAAKRVGCTTLVTGEIKLHAAVAARAADVAVIAVGHHASERFSMAAFARRLAESLPGLVSWASRDEADPLSWIA